MAQKYDMIWCTLGPVYVCTREVRCRVLGTTKRRVRIAAQLHNNKEEVRLVTVGTLAHEPCHCFSECRVLENLRKRVGAEAVCGH